MNQNLALRNKVLRRLAQLRPALWMKGLAKEVTTRGNEVWASLFDIATDSRGDATCRLAAIRMIVDVMGTKEFIALGLEPLRNMVKDGDETQAPDDPSASAEDATSRRYAEVVADAEVVAPAPPAPPPRPSGSPRKPRVVHAPRVEGPRRKAGRSG